MARSYPYLKSAQTVYKEWLDRLPRRWYLCLPIFWSREKRLSPKLTALAIPAPDPTSSRGTVLFAVLGLTGRTLEEVLELVAKEIEVTSITAVFVTDSLDFDPFRKRRLRFEYFPDRGKWQRFAPDLDWDLYERHRYALLRDKWNPRSLIWFGRPPPAECAAIINWTTARPHRLLRPVQ